MAKKGLAVWICSSLTFLSVTHLVEAIYDVVSGAEIKLLAIYPLVGEKLGSADSLTYLWFSAATSLVLWGITCAVAFENPVEDFLKRMLSDAKKQGAVETQMLEGKSELLDAMYETIESSSATIAGVKDLISNVRTEVKIIQPLATTVDLVRQELSDLTKEVEQLEGKMNYQYLCLARGKPLLPEFKICPYCSEEAKLFKTPVLATSEEK